jgi:hypothetical protein
MGRAYGLSSIVLSFRQSLGQYRRNLPPAQLDASAVNFLCSHPRHTKKTSLRSPQQANLRPANRTISPSDTEYFTALFAMID